MLPPLDSLLYDAMYTVVHHYHSILLNEKKKTIVVAFLYLLLLPFQCQATNSVHSSRLEWYVQLYHVCFLKIFVILRALGRPWWDYTR